MFDFFISLAPGTQPQPAEHTAPFSHLQRIPQHTFALEHYLIGDCRIDIVNRNAGHSTYHDEHFFVLRYGYCFLQHSSQDAMATGDLSGERLAELYRLHGDRFTSQIKGSFAILIIDKDSGAVHLFTDPLNLKTVYYAESPGALLLSSSQAAIIEYWKQQGRAATLDARAMLDWYLFDFILDEHTYFEGIREVPPGSALKAEGGQFEVNRYFDPFTYFDLSGPRYNEKEGVEALQKMLWRNIQLYTEGPEHTAIALTGGFDSRSIAALLGEELDHYQLFSYGYPDSWDLKIPEQIAEKLQLNYTPIHLNGAFTRAFPAAADLAVLLSDGLSGFGNANISYAYQHHLPDKRSLLTGLFGSELVKIPSSRGMIFDQHEVDLLNAPKGSREAILQRLLQKAKSAGLGLPFEDGRADEEWLQAMRSNPYFNNDLPVSQRFFFYLLMVAMRKYFRTEIRIQSLWKANRHPYFDIEFIKLLLQTPFPWVYHFAQKKSLVKNIRIHKLYGTLINQNPALSNIISTHGYRPKNVLRPHTLPLLALEFWLHKRRIRSVTDVDYPTLYSMQHIEQTRGEALRQSGVGAAELKSDRRNYMKLAALQYWLQHQGLSL